MHRSTLFSLAAVALLCVAGCASPLTPASSASAPAPSQVAAVAQKADAVIQAGCADGYSAINLADANLKGGALNTVQPYADLVVSGCHDEAAIAALVADPTSANWLQGLTTTLKTAVAVANVVSASK